MGEEMPHRFINAAVLLRCDWCYNRWCFEGYMTSILEGPRRYICIVSSIYLSVSFLEIFSTWTREIQADSSRSGVIPK